MDTSIVLITLELLLIAEIFSQYHHRERTHLYSLSERCKIDREHLGDRMIDMRDGTEVQGRKVKLKSSYCELRDVDEYRGLKYAELNLSDKKAIRFLPNRDLTRPKVKKDDKGRIATEYKPVCPQKFIDEVTKSWNGIPEQILERLVKIGSFTKKQIEACLWLNLYVPYIGKIIKYLYQ